MENVRFKDQTPKDGIWYHFTQQSSKAWTPRYTSGNVSPLFLFFGIVLIPIGIGVLILTSDSATDIKEFRLDYTHCVSVTNNSMTCAQHLESSQSGIEQGVCQCNVEFELTKPIKGKKIYMYYALDNYYQNARQYVKSRDDSQLRGKLGTVQKPYVPSKDCAPYDKDNGKIIFPCGAVADSMFNDSLQLYFNDDVEGEVEIQQIRRGIAWSADRYRYKNPSESFENPRHEIWDKYTQPKGWSRTIFDLDPSDPDNNGVQNEDFIVWMRVSAFSNFQKLYRIIKPPNQDILGDRLPAGKYILRVNYTYEVVSFNGKKAIVLSTTTFFGQQNIFQGIAAISLGGVAVVLGLLFLLCGCTNSHGKGSFSRPESPNDDL